MQIRAGGNRNFAYPVVCRAALLALLNGFAQQRKKKAASSKATFYATVSGERTYSPDTAIDNVRQGTQRGGLRIMPWTKLCDHFDINQKILDLQPESIAYYVGCLTWCNRNLTDGMIPKAKAGNILRVNGRKKISVKRAVADLLRAGCFLETGEAYAVKDYLQFNKKSSQILSERERNRAKVGKWRALKSADKGLIGQMGEIGNPVTRPVSDRSPVPSKALESSNSAAMLRSSELSGNSPVAASVKAVRNKYTNFKRLTAPARKDRQTDPQPSNQLDLGARDPENICPPPPISPPRAGSGAITHRPQGHQTPVEGPHTGVAIPWHPPGPREALRGLRDVAEIASRSGVEMVINRTTHKLLGEVVPLFTWEVEAACAEARRASARPNGNFMLSILKRQREDQTFHEEQPTKSSRRIAKERKAAQDEIACARYFELAPPMVELSGPSWAAMTKREQMQILNFLEAQLADEQDDPNHAELGKIWQDLSPPGLDGKPREPDLSKMFFDWTDEDMERECAKYADTHQMA